MYFCFIAVPYQGNSKCLTVQRYGLWNYYPNFVRYSEISPKFAILVEYISGLALKFAFKQNKTLNDGRKEVDITFFCNYQLQKNVNLCA